MQITAFRNIFGDTHWKLRRIHCTNLRYLQYPFQQPVLNYIARVRRGSRKLWSRSQPSAEEESLIWKERNVLQEPLSVGTSPSALRARRLYLSVDNARLVCFHHAQTAFLPLSMRDITVSETNLNRLSWLCIQLVSKSIQF